MRPLRRWQRDEQDGQGSPRRLPSGPGTIVRGVGRSLSPSRSTPTAPAPRTQPGVRHLRLPPSPHTHHPPGEVGKYLNPLPETGDYVTISKLNFTEHFCPATSVGGKWRLRSCASPSPRQLSAWLHLRARAAAARTCKMSSP